MSKWFVTFAAVAVMTSFAPALSMAQGVGVEVPGVGGVRIGDQIGPATVKIAITIVHVTARAENSESVKGVTVGDVRPSPFSAMMDP
jgi:hypothetical protein